MDVLNLTSIVEQLKAINRHNDAMEKAIEHFLSSKAHQEEATKLYGLIFGSGARDAYYKRYYLALYFLIGEEVVRDKGGKVGSSWRNSVRLGDSYSFHRSDDGNRASLDVDDKGHLFVKLLLTYDYAYSDGSSIREESLYCESLLDTNVDCTTLDSAFYQWMHDNFPGEMSEVKRSFVEEKAAKKLKAKADAEARETKDREEFERLLKKFGPAKEASGDKNGT